MGILLPGSIDIGVRSWNDKTANRWPRVLICRASEATCAARNTDNHVVEVRVEGEGGCGDAIACAGPMRRNPAEHLEDMSVIIEEPARGWNLKGAYVRHFWIEDLSLDGFETTTGATLRHLPSVVAHEFGHTLGLYDLYYQRDDQNNYIYPVEHYLMGHRLRPVVPWTDQLNVKQLYLNKHGGVAHN